MIDQQPRFPRILTGPELQAMEFTDPPGMETFVCKNCGPVGADVRHQEMHIGAYCNGCGRWIKWVRQTPELLDWLSQQ